MRRPAIHWDPSLRRGVTLPRLGRSLIVVALASAGLGVWLGLGAAPSAHADHEGYKYWMECSEEGEFYEPASGRRQFRITIMQTGHGPTVRDGVSYREGLVVTWEHGTTSDADLELSTNHGRVQTRLVSGFSGNDFKTVAVLDNGDTVDLDDVDEHGNLNVPIGRTVQLDADDRMVLTQVSTGEVIEAAVASFNYYIAGDDIAEHDETFTVSFQRVRLDQDGQIMETGGQYTPHGSLSDYVYDMTDPERDNKCEPTILDRDPVITEVGGYFTENFNSTPPQGIGNTLGDHDCSQTLRFYVDWIARTESSPDSWEEVDADRWDYHIHTPSNLKKVFSGARFNIQFGTRQAVVTTGRYGLAAGATLTVNYLTGTITGAGDTGPGAFHVRVRPRVDGQWQPYSKPMDFYCSNDPGGF